MEKFQLHSPLMRRITIPYNSNLRGFHIEKKELVCVSYLYLLANIQALHLSAFSKSDQCDLFSITSGIYRCWNYSFKPAKSWKQSLVFPKEQALCTSNNRHLPNNKHKNRTLFPTLGTGDSRTKAQNTLLHCHRNDCEVMLPAGDWKSSQMVRFSSWKAAWGYTSDAVNAPSTQNFV